MTGAASVECSSCCWLITYSAFRLAHYTAI